MAASSVHWRYQTRGQRTWLLRSFLVKKDIHLEILQKIVAFCNVDEIDWGIDETECY